MKLQVTFFHNEGKYKPKGKDKRVWHWQDKRTTRVSAQGKPIEILC